MFSILGTLTVKSCSHARASQSSGFSLLTDFKCSPLHEIRSRQAPQIPTEGTVWSMPIWHPAPNSQHSDFYRRGLEACYMEAIILACHVYWTLLQEGPDRGVHDKLFLRYFERGDFDFVKGCSDLDVSDLRFANSHDMTNILLQLYRYICVGVRRE